MLLEGDARQADSSLFGGLEVKKKKRDQNLHVISFFLSPEICLCQDLESDCVPFRLIG